MVIFYGGVVADTNITIGDTEIELATQCNASSNYCDDFWIAKLDSNGTVLWYDVVGEEFNSDSSTGYVNGYVGFDEVSIQKMEIFSSNFLSNKQI